MERIVTVYFRLTSKCTRRYNTWMAKNKLEIAQNIRIDGIYVYKYNVFSKEYSMITTPEELPYGYYEEFE